MYDYNEKNLAGLKLFIIVWLHFNFQLSITNVGNNRFKICYTAKWLYHDFQMVLFITVLILLY